MNPKIEKLRNERSRNADKIGNLQERNRKLDEQITKLENSEIIGMVREIRMTPEQLAELLQQRQPLSTETCNGTVSEDDSDSNDIPTETDIEQSTSDEPQETEDKGWA